jgi:hypothetical protein
MLRTMRLAGDSLLATASFLLLVGCAAVPRTGKDATAASHAAEWTPTLADSLAQLGRDDQRGRDALVRAVASQDTTTVFATIRADSNRTRWLRRNVERYGWPTRAVVGDSPALAAWLLLQHSPDTEWQSRMVSILEQQARAGEFALSELALLTDRILVSRGLPQRYGSQFDLVEGRLVPSAIENIRELDARRASMGLPTMATYVSKLAEVYKLPVEWPPAS